MNQGDLDRQRLLGNRQRIGIYESNHEDGDNDGFENQERYDSILLFRKRQKYYSSPFFKSSNQNHSLSCIEQNLIETPNQNYKHHIS